MHSLDRNREIIGTSEESHELHVMLENQCELGKKISSICISSVTFLGKVCCRKQEPKPIAETAVTSIPLDKWEKIKSTTEKKIELVSGLTRIKELKKDTVTKVQSNIKQKEEELKKLEVRCSIKRNCLEANTDSTSSDYKQLVKEIEEFGDRIADLEKKINKEQEELKLFIENMKEDPRIKKIKEKIKSHDAFLTEELKHMSFTKLKMPES